MAAPAQATGGAALAEAESPTTPTPTPADQLAPDRPPRGRSGGGASTNSPGSVPRSTSRDIFVPLGGRSAGQGSLPGGVPPRKRSIPRPPQGHSGYADQLERKLPRRDGVPPRYSNANCKQRMLQAALRVASQRGYESMRISEITDPVGVTRQAFYAHFRDKRHCLCEAIDPSLGAIERTAATLAESDPEAAAKVIHALDDLIAERFGSAEGRPATLA